MAEPTCATCLHLVIGRRVVRCGTKQAPREALRELPACERYEEARDGLREGYVAAQVEVWPWAVSEASGATEEGRADVSEAAPNAL